MVEATIALQGQGEEIQIRILDDGFGINDITTGLQNGSLTITTWVGMKGVTKTIDDAQTGDLVAEIL